MLETRKSSSSADRVPLSAIFNGFLKVSLCGFGGGLVWARRAVVEQRQCIGWQSVAITAGAVATVLGTRLNPLWILAAGGFSGGLGLLLVHPA